MPSLSAADFRRLGEFVRARTGIKVTEGKKTLFESRLQKRLKQLGLGDFGRYCEFLFSDEGIKTELHLMIDAVTTHKTDFFREPDHFDFLSGAALPELLAMPGKARIQVWSAACSTGEEPYTIAMALCEYGKKLASGNLDFIVLASDISAGVLRSARRAIYAEQQIAPIPIHLRKKYLLRSKDRTKGLFRIAPEVRVRVSFFSFNLAQDDFERIFPDQADIIFCRNVVIYFDRYVQEKLMRRICGKLSPGGFLFMGHAEAIHGPGLPLVKVAPSVYRRIA